MRPFRYAILFLVCAVIQLVPSPAAAGGVGAEVLQYPIGVRSYGMGQTGVADNADPSNLYFNPANLATVHGALLTGSFGKLYPNFVSDWWIGNVGVSGGYQTTLDNSTEVGFGGDVRYGRRDLGESIATNTQGLELGSFSSHESYLGISAAGGMVFSERIHVAVGATFKYVWIEYVPDDFALEGIDGTANTVAFDMGLRVAANLFEDSGHLFVPAAGISYVNLGPGIEFTNREQSDDLPRAVRYGLSGRFESSSSPEIDDVFNTRLPLVSISVNIDVMDSQVTERANVYGVGFEVEALKILFVRLGYIKVKDGDVKDPTYGAGLGLPYNKFRARFDYARVPTPGRRDDENRFGISIGALF